MSRYVDLNGVSWDGKPISSKIQEVKTKYGFMQGITIGWLWGDNVPHIDLEEHDKQIRAYAIDDFANWLVEQGILGSRCISEGEITDYGKIYAKKYKKQLKEGGKE